MSIEAQQRQEANERRERLWGKPSKVNLHKEYSYAKQRIAELQAEGERLAEQKRAEREREILRLRESKRLRGERVAKTEAEKHCLSLTWTQIRPVHDDGVWSMKDVAYHVLKHFPMLTFDDIKGRSRMHLQFNARKMIAEGIDDLVPNSSSTKIGNFLNRDHTSVLNMLGRVKAGSKRKDHTNVKK